MEPADAHLPPPAAASARAPSGERATRTTSARRARARRGPGRPKSAASLPVMARARRARARGAARCAMRRRARSPALARGAFTLAGCAWTARGQVQEERHEPGGGPQRSASSSASMAKRMPSFPFFLLAIGDSSYTRSVACLRPSAGAEAGHGVLKKLDRRDNLCFQPIWATVDSESSDSSRIWCDHQH